MFFALLWLFWILGLWFVRQKEKQKSLTEQGWQGRVNRWNCSSWKVQEARSHASTQAAVSQVAVAVAREQLSKLGDSKWVCERKNRETVTEKKTEVSKIRSEGLTYLVSLVWVAPVNALWLVFFLFSRPCLIMPPIPADPAYRFCVWRGWKPE